VPALAEQLTGEISRVDVAGKKIAVIAGKGAGEEVEVSVTDATVLVTHEGEEGKLDLEKLEKGIEERVKNGEPGPRVEVTHEKGVASKIRSTGSIRILGDGTIEDEATPEPKGVKNQWPPKKQ
jgi:hypothetical protein